jgi:hypothetical protein
LSQVNLNVEIPNAAFSLSVPADVVPMTLEELRRVRPLAESSAGHRDP